MEPRLYLHWLKNNELIEGRLKMHDLNMQDMYEMHRSVLLMKMQDVKC